MAEAKVVRGASTKRGKTVHDIMRQARRAELTALEAYKKSGRTVGDWDSFERRVNAIYTARDRYLENIRRTPTAQRASREYSDDETRYPLSVYARRNNRRR